MEKEYTYLDYDILISFIDGDHDIVPLFKQIIENKMNYENELWIEEGLEDKVSSISEYYYQAFITILNRRLTLKEFVKNHHFSTVYNTLYKYCFKDLKNDDSLSEFYKTAINTYNYQRKLNILLGVETEPYDRFLIGCVIGELAKYYPDSYVMKFERNKLLTGLIEYFEENEIDIILEEPKKLQKQLF